MELHGDHEAAQTYKQHIGVSFYNPACIGGVVTVTPQNKLLLIKIYTIKLNWLVVD